MKEHLQVKRNVIIYRVWQEWKGTITMEELSEIFGMPLNKAYRIIKKVGEAEEELNK